MNESQDMKQIVSYSVEEELNVTHFEGKHHACRLEGQDTRAAKRGSATLGAR